MGIIILPWLFIVFIIVIISIIKSIRLIKYKIVGLKEIILGLIISICLFVIISLSYIIEGRAWGLSPSFRLPFFMVFIPFIIHLSTANSKNYKIKYISNIILLSIALSGFWGIIFNDTLFNLIDYLKIEKYY